MTDRELLEAAARAADMPYAWNTGAELMLHTLPDATALYWRPLDDDGDALRLAVKLHFTLRLYMGHACVQSTVPGGPSVYIDEMDFSDPGAATRRAIVRAAAAIALKAAA